MDEQRMIDYEVMDANGSRIGSIDAVWLDTATGEPEFYGIKTGWIFGRTHLVPARDVRQDDTARALHVPYDKERLKDAPSFDAGDDLRPEDEERIYAHYGIARDLRESPTGLPSGETRGDTARRGRGATGEGESIRLAEEQLDVGKREIDTGARLRKVVRTERVEQPVELRREELHVDRVPARGDVDVPSDAFTEREIEMRATREEPVVGKTARVSEEIRAYKTEDVERRTIEGDVRKEDVEVDRERTADAERSRTRDRI